MKRYQSVADAADAIVEQLDGYVVLGMPLGLGKPNPLVNALYRRACADSRITLIIATALSLGRPRASGGLQKRFLDPFVERVYGDYLELDYLQAMRRGALPENVEVHEFYVQPAAELGNPYAQQNYINSNYTHAARDMFARGINLVAQSIARRQGETGEEFSLGSNPEVVLDLLPMLDERRRRGQPVIIAGQVHDQMPFMVNSAQVDEAMFDIIVDDPTGHHSLVNTPNMPVGMVEHFIGLAASALVRDGGTLQIGIGALGDALAGSLLLRHRDNAAYRELLEQCRYTPTWFDALEETGTPGVFEQGLYGCSEMFTYGLFRLMQEGVIKREVEGPGGQPVCMTAGFFLGPNAFYEGLRGLSPEQLARIDMTRISFVNGLLGEEMRKRAQRVHGRFINTAFSVTLLGAAVADQLEDGRVLSGVGGQYNFVAQAHELAGARSILLVRATRNKGGTTTSNILWNYGHTTIPRHLRDIVVTEYGVADLRGRTDAEVIGAMLNICDSRFQPELLEQARAAGKLPRDYQIPRAFTSNTPSRLQEIYRQHRAAGRFQNFPLGSDFSFTEELLLQALAWLKTHVQPRYLAELARSGAADEATARRFSAHLERMGFGDDGSLKDRLYRQLLLKALQAVSE